jgi:hypothetical protein
MRSVHLYIAAQSRLASHAIAKTTASTIALKDCIKAVY